MPRNVLNISQKEDVASKHLQSNIVWNEIRGIQTIEGIYCMRKNKKYGAVGLCDISLFQHMKLHSFLAGQRSPTVDSPVLKYITWLPSRQWPASYSHFFGNSPVPIPLTETIY